MSIKILITLSEVQHNELTLLMAEDLQDARAKSAYVGYLINQERKRRIEQAAGMTQASVKRPPGRPRKDGEEEPASDLPSEHAPKNLTLPTHLRPYVLPKDRQNPVNEYDILMLEAKRESHEATQG